MSVFSYELNSHQVALVTIDVPGEKMNTLRDSFADELLEILEQGKKDDVTGMVFVSGKADNFIAGADIKMLDNANTREDALRLSEMCQQAFFKMKALPFPTVAAIHGAALGGGLEFALACDYRVCTSDDKTKLGLPEVQLGLLPGGGGTQRLPKLVGIQKALEWMLTGKQVRAKQAAKAGLVDESVPYSILMDVAVKLARKGKPRVRKPKLDKLSQLLESNPFGRNIIFKKAQENVEKKTGGHYPAPLAIIKAVRASVELDELKAYKTEAEGFADLVMTDVSRSLRGIFFATTEMKKEWQSDDTAKIERAAVLGGGLMGAGITHVSAVKAGARVRIKDVAHQGISNALNYSYNILSKKQKRRILSKAQMQSAMNSITGTTDYSGFEHIDIVIEAVFEDLALKQGMVADIERECADSTIFASNTSSLPIAQIAEKAARPENVIGLHYFSPVEKMPLVEIIPHEGTSEQTIAKTVNFARKQGKTPIVVKDKAGFYVNRILAPYVNEAANLLLAGEPIDKIDQALVEFGFPVGPLALLDEVGIDIGSKIAPILEKELGERFKGPNAFERMIDSKRLGRKTGRGFYTYEGKKGKKVDESVYDLLGITQAPRLNKQEIANRCVAQMLNEASRCLDEGIIASPRDGDIGAIFGIGFPPFLGGPFSYMDKRGLNKVCSELSTYATENDVFTPSEPLQAKAEAGEAYYG
ncbi:fatty acid oxidation complex subunit alpha FadJ [Pseudoalteromonas luteoviolacea]|uniref:enoyl-CoA hydratase n=1 Tax=Pseudoalteromonas luteoviolacea S4054 TaxID=1129367 RepID=A0A0F6AIL0_9GAMM|nr:fatty acid oxidation complex subunit alpha FadJ [Pseudoalteromonas luteoviolacea]AOT07942.1 multifunctional fatty acid oxidation complex subunit alpha [Pseudoalteromonas luteoviolacea]AOT12858.1 multifunctional fatty acid oxidation complex subunit alpha [Pseudoalteromonas luteoviolacea]AOT17771.1 multifunctional fatty acid oxidation complex subunit alpha [Pseudoalteromonas luteoviolacea]KKE85816.1 fatty-acid oxidation protein subunit alpha [Pseudoalteromonas luteoviolacea S4054]KZN74694.1 f